MKGAALAVVIAAFGGVAHAAPSGFAASASHFAQSGGPSPSASPAPTAPAPAPMPLKLPPPPLRPRPTDPIAARYSVGYEGCMHHAVSTLDMVDCAGREADRWDGRLNRAYKARMSEFNARQRDALTAAERAWLAFRKADCAAYEDEDWGTISHIDASQCFLRRTVERTLELEAFPTDHGPG